jgi:hypothetical protein
MCTYTCIFFTYETCVVLKLLLRMTDPMRMDCLEDIVNIIFEELDPVWLKGIWDGDDDTRHDMIKILHLIYLLKTRP